MNLKKLVYTLTLVTLLTSLLSGQNPPAKRSPDDQLELKKEAITFLRETMADVNNLRTLENRISFSAELAGLMWFHDEKEARSLYVTSFDNFKELLMAYDQQMNSYGLPEDDNEDPYGYRGGPLFGDVSEKAKLMRRFRIAMQVRQQIAMSLAEHDPELAFGFYFESLSALSNPTFRKLMEDRDGYFESQLITQIAETNAARAAEFAGRSVRDGFAHYHIDLLRKIYEKDAEKGAELASAMLSKIKSDKNSISELWVVSSFLNLASDSFEKSKLEGGRRPMLDRDALRDLADTFGQAILNNESESGSGLQYVAAIEKYAPARALQIRAKFKNATIGPGTAGYAYNAAANAANTVAGYANSASNSSNSASNSRAERDRLDREKAEKELAENVGKLGNAQLPKDERDKIVALARRILVQTPGKDKKIAGLSALAAQVARAGDKELAAEIMKDAQALVSPVPKTYQDFLLAWMLASGYAESDPEKAFPLLEDTIARANDTISAFIKVGEFIDVAGEFIDEGEVQVGAFGGQVVRGLTSELGMADNTLRTLAKADFKKTRDLTSRFDRSEVRILAKMMILRAILGQKKPQGKKPELSADN